MFLLNLALFKTDLLETQVMGWSSLESEKINETIVKNVVDVLAQSPMRRNGYQYILLEDNIFENTRSQDGSLIPRKEQFQSGFEKLILYIHQMGFKVGVKLQSSDFKNYIQQGSFGYEAEDVKQLYELGFDMISYTYKQNSVSKQQQAPNIGDLEVCGNKYKISKKILFDGAIIGKSNLVENITKNKGYIQWDIKIGNQCKNNNFLLLDIADSNGGKVLMYSINNKTNYIYVNKNKTESENKQDLITIKLQFDEQDLIINQHNIIKFYLNEDIQLFSKYSIKQFLDVFVNNDSYQNVIVRVADSGVSNSQQWANNLTHLFQSNQQKISQIEDILQIYKNNSQEFKPFDANFQNQLFHLNLDMNTSYIDLQLTIIAMLQSPLLFTENTFNILNIYQKKFVNPDFILIYNNKLNARLNIVNRSDNNYDVLARELLQSQIAFFVINTNGLQFQSIVINLRKLGDVVFEDNEKRNKWNQATVFWCKNVWLDEEYQKQDVFRFLIPPIASGMFRCYAE